jgi:type II secretory pathway predicted ATPase ExeA
MNLFEPESLEAMYQATSGLPRKVNLLAHFALNAAALQNAKAVTAEHIMMAAEEMG